MEWWYTVLSGLLGALGGAVGTKLVSNYLALRGGVYELDRAKRSDAIKELQTIIDQLQEDLANVKVELRAVSEKLDEEKKHHTSCQVAMARWEVWAQAVNDDMAHAGIKLRPWPGTGGSSANEHR